MDKRPLVAMCIGYIIGIIIQNFCPTILFVIIEVAICLMFVLLFNEIDIKTRLLVVIMISLGFFYSRYIISLDRSDAAKYSNQSVTLEGTYVNKIKREDDYYSFVIKVNKINKNKIKTELSKVNYYTKENINLNYGDLINVSGTIIIPDDMRNPGGFDYRQYLLSQKIYTIIKAKNVILLKQDGGNYSQIKKLSMKIKDNIQSIIISSMPNQQSALLQGILISETEFLDDSIITDFRNSGISHLMAVSGLNVAYIVLVIVYILKKLRVKGALSNFILTLVLILFALITGCSSSVIRAIIMSLMVVYGASLKRKTDVLTSIGFSALCILLYNPINLYSVGFLLSFGATLSIIFLYKSIRKHTDFLPKYIADLLAVSLSVQIGITPISIYFFNDLSIISIFINLIAVPISGLVTILGIVLIGLGQIHIILANFLGFFLKYLLSFLIIISKAPNYIPNSVLTLTTPSIYGIVFYYIFIYIVFFKYAWIKENIHIKNMYKLSVVIIVVSIFMILHKKPLEVSMIDVGQGDAIYIRTPSGRVALIDAGGFSNDKNDGGGVIVPFLLDKKVHKIDVMFISHTDNDHICGINEIIDKFKIDRTVFSDRVKNNEIIKTLNKAKSKIFYVNSYGNIKFDEDISFEMFATGTNFNDINDDESLIVCMNYNKRNFLFAGDASVNLENELIDKLHKKYDILKIGHHGSGTSTSQEFLNRINPKIALISVGKGNKFKHPSDSVIERLNANEIKTYRTDETGCISLFSDGNYIKVKTMTGD